MITMKMKAWVVSLIIATILTIGLIILCDHIWPEYKIMTKVVPLLVGAVITHMVRKYYDFITNILNLKTGDPFLGILIKVNHTSRRFIGYGASCGEIVHAGSFRANYEVEVELKIMLQNESANTAYEIEVSYTPNQFSKNYTLRDTRENKLQPLEGNKHFEFILRIVNHFYDVYASDVDDVIRKIYKVGKEKSLLNGSKLNIKYKDSSHKAHIKTEVLE